MRVGPPRSLPFVLLSTDHGTIITSRLDWQEGYGNMLFDRGSYEPFQIGCILDLLDLRRKHYGDGVFALDCGAHIGIQTVEWARHMTGWGHVVAFEAQQRLFYAVAGNIAINNCFNAEAYNLAIADRPGVLTIPALDYFKTARFGGLELKPTGRTENIGQAYEYGASSNVQVHAASIDSMDLARVDLIKLDIEGMEIDGLRGAAKMLANQKPILVLEIIKSDVNALGALLMEAGYKLYRLGNIDMLAVHADDKCAGEIATRDWTKEG